MTMRKKLCVQFKKKCAVCPVKVSFITKFCDHSFECDVPRMIQKRKHDYNKDLTIAHELINTFAYLTIPENIIYAYNDIDMSGLLTDEQREYAMKVLIK